MERCGRGQGAGHPERPGRKLQGQAPCLRQAARKQRPGVLHRLDATRPTPRFNTDIQPNGKGNPAGTKAKDQNRQGLPERAVAAAALLGRPDIDRREVSIGENLPHMREKMTDRQTCAYFRTSLATIHECHYLSSLVIDLQLGQLADRHQTEK